MALKHSPIVIYTLISNKMCLRQISIIALDLSIKDTTKNLQNCKERHFTRLNSHTKYQFKANVKNNVLVRTFVKEENKEAMNKPLR